MGAIVRGDVCLGAIYAWVQLLGGVVCLGAIHAWVQELGGVVCLGAIPGCNSLEMWHALCNNS